MAEKTSFLSVPLKTTREVDLVKPIVNYIETMYQIPDDVKVEAKEAAEDLNKLRQEACIQPLDKQQCALEILTRYFDQLVVIENKLPITATQNPISFKWKNAFDKGVLFFGRASITSNESSFERAAVLFNVGALMSAIAANQGQGLDEELRTCAKLFQQSSGVFLHLKDTVLRLVQQDPTHDLMPDTLAALSAIMLAQAQEATLIKAEKDNKKSALSKLAAGCSELYGESQKLMYRDSVKGIFDKAWLNMVNGKAIAFNAFAQYHEGNSSLERVEIGNALCRFGEAVNLANQAIALLPPSLYSSQFMAITRAHENATKDNDFIYHARIADIRSLPVVQSSRIVKPMPLKNPITANFRDIFSSLVPIQVQQALASFQARKADLANSEMVRLREYTQIMNEILACYNLPAALDDVITRQDLPESIRMKSSKVKAAGGIDLLFKYCSDLPDLAKRNQEILDETFRLLKEEKEEDDHLRTQFKEKWTRLDSAKLTEPLYQECGKYRAILQAAINVDKTVQEKMADVEEAMRLLSLPESELKASIPELDQSSFLMNSTPVQKLRELMEGTKEIKAERKRMETEFPSVQCDMSNHFLQAMTDNQIINEEQISKQKLSELFDPLKKKVEESIKRQENCLEEVTRWNKEFSSGNGVEASGRQQILKKLATGYDKYFEIKSNVEEGSKFYNELTTLLLRLQQKVADFCFARQTEKEDLMKQLQKNIVSGSGSKPPMRPPPPKVSQSSTNSFGVEESIAPPSSVSSLQAANDISYLNQSSSGSCAPPLGTASSQPMCQPYIPQFYYPQPLQNFIAPYPIVYPTTYPGAFGVNAQGYGNFPPQPQPQWRNQSPGKP